MSADHRDCDARLAELEDRLGAGDLAAVRRQFGEFAAAMRRHLDCEEQILFPAFEAASGIRGGPTAVMRMEHEQIRGLLDAIDSTIDQGDSARVSGYVDTLMILIQQHNMKEEQVLYPMCEDAIGVGDPVREQVVAALSHGN
jgi:hemerythrin-like domain-containing protein